MLSFFRKELSWFSLRYKTNHIEREYKQDKENFQRWNCKIFVPLFVFLGVFLWAAGLGSPDTYTKDRIIFNFLRLCLIPGVFILVKCFPKWVEETIIATMALSLIGYVELSRDLLPEFKYFDAYVYGLLVQSFFIFFLLLRIDFKRLFWVLMFLNCYVALRMFHVEKLDSDFFKACMMHVTNFIMLSSFSYWRDLFDRKVYFDMKKYEELLSLYEKLIKEIIPVSVIIYDDHNIFFSNSESRRVLNLSDKEFNQVKLNEISVFESNVIRGAPSGKSPLLTERREINHKTLLDLMRDTLPTPDIISCSIALPLNETAGKLGKEQLYIKCKISRVFWDEKIVKIMFLTEDHNALEVKMLQQREIYKSRFLSTISHEFRTPLNGIIGMITSVADACENFELKSR